jgi:hypothetical protein
MARHIDDSKPLSDEDRQWLTDWSRTAEIERIDALHGVESDGEQGAFFDDLHPLQSGSDFSGEQEEPEDPLKGETDMGASQADSPAEVPDNWTQETDDEPYDDWTKDDLADELGERGLTKSGNKDELVSRLRDSDAG